MTEARQFGEAENGTDNRIGVGEKFVLVLDENPTSGYRWTITHSGEPVCRLISDEFEPAKPLRPGSVGRHRWFFQAVSPGKAEIQLTHGRKWEEKPSESFAFAIEVDRA